MRIWNAIRRFSGIGKRVRADHSVRRASKRQGPTLSSLINRGLRMEQFEERMLLSISPSNLSELWEVNADLARSIENATNLGGYSAEELASATQWVVGLSSSDESSSFHALAANADYLTETGYLPNAAIWEFDASLDWNTVVDTLECDGKIDYYYPLVLKTDYIPMFVPNDPYFEYEWHLNNTGQSGGTPGVDANVTTAWDSVLGTGVVIGIVDDGIDHTHQDIASSYRADLSWDFASDDSDPTPANNDSHGTAVAGVAAATGMNDEGVAGAAPDADLVGLRISYDLGWTDYTESQIFTHEYQEIDIYNNSWGAAAHFTTQGPLSEAAMHDGVTNGRSGLGNIYVFSAGNSREGYMWWEFTDNTNYHEYQNNRYAITVAAINENGVFTDYSTPGTSVFVSGHSNGIYTTDRLGDMGYNRTTDASDGDPFHDIDYTSNFNGTSSSAPLVSGVIALILEANPNLSYRDVQHILAQSSTMNDPSDSDWVFNGAGYHVNKNYGFGAINATAAVNLAYDWENVSGEKSTSSGIIDVNQAIADGSSNAVTSTFEMDDSIDAIEWVELNVDISHIQGTDIELILTSPSGTQSNLLDATETDLDARDNGLRNWRLSSCHFWGESSEGEWTVEVRDRISGTSGTFNNFELKVYGTNDDGPIDPPVVVAEAIGLELVDVIPNSGNAITEGSTQHVAPRELTLVFNDEQTIDPATIGAISMKRAGGDDIFLNLNDEAVDFGYVAIGDRPNEIVIRFAETLPDDMYQLTILGTGDAPLATIGGNAFHAGEDLTITFNLDLGAQVTAIVPQPTTRDADTGAISQSRDTIEVYFNNDTLDQASAETTEFYRLAVTNETATTNDDIEVFPTSVAYDPITNKAILTFAQDLADYGTGAFRLRIGNEYQEIETSAITAELVADVFSDATVIEGIGGASNGQSVIISSIIEPQPYDIIFPGGTDELGHRNLPSASEVEGHYLFGADSEYGTSTIYYNFDQNLGGGFYNQITESQKQLTRQIFELYGNYLGIDFIEDTALTGGRGLIVGTGDLQALDPLIPSAPGGVIGLAGSGVAVMDMAENWNNEYNGSWFNTAMHEIGHLLGLGHAYDLPGFTVMGNNDTEYYVANTEAMYPGIVDVIHGQYMHRPDSIDVDVYNFTLDTDGTVSAEIIAERLDNSSLLDSVITIYDENGQMIARNDDYYSEDSYVELTLTAGTYYVAISSTGNTEFDPNVPCSGEGGTSQGEYDLRLSFLPTLIPGQAVDSEHMVDTTGTMFDGDTDGIQGGVYNFWFDVQAETDTLFVDKTAVPEADGGYADPTAPLGSLANPYTQIDEALADANEGQIVRIVGNRVQDFDYHNTVKTFDAPQDVAVGDFNNDGVPDLVTIAQDNHDEFYAQIYFGIDGTDYLVTPVNYLIGTNPTDVKVGDLNNDGADDIIITNSGEATLSLLINNGDGSFAPNATRFTGDEPVAVELGDLNGDGRLDLVVANQASNTIGVFLSNNVSFFADQVAYTVGSQPGAVTVGDVNNDGMVDIVSINQDGTISVLLNAGKDSETGRTTFAEQVSQEITGNLTAGILADFNEDGTNDLALTDATTNQLAILIGLGDGTFDTPTYRTVGTDPTDIGIGDSDDDGHLDLFVLNQGSNNVSVLFGLGNGTFGAEQVYDVGTSPSGIAIADADRNGRPDIIVANEGNDTISILTAVRDQAYEIGSDDLNGNALEDGWRMEVPKDVTVMIDAGSVFKLRGANIDVGSSSQGIDRSEGALQVLGTPQNSVYFTSFHDKTLGVDNATPTDKATQGDWGGLVFRSKIDYDTERVVLESEGIFVNYVNNAEFYYGGGQVTVNSVRQVYTPIHMIESRPTVTFNEVYLSADAAMSADPNSFADTKFQGDDFTSDYDRVGPDIYGNTVIDNSLNGLNIRINTAAGNVLEHLEICARFDDTDIVHILGENLIIGSTPGGPTLAADRTSLDARTDGRLMIDPGIVLKLNQSRIETEIGAQFIAEGTDELPVVLTSYLDTRYGMGGTFETTNIEGNYAPDSGDWSGLYFGPTSTASIDNAVIAYGGGTSRVKGGFADFNVVEVHQAQFRLTNSELEFNQGITTTSNRVGREGTESSVIYIKGAQPVLTNNVIINNSAPAININANSLTNDYMPDWGRSTGLIDAFDQYPDNSGPLVRDNRLYNNDINGMLVRGEVLSTASIWDDTDIVHVLQSEIVIPNFHTEGGLRLESAPDESLVVKLLGSNAGFTALGTPSEIDDRIGGTLQIIGMPGFPVVLTSLLDDTVGAGVDPWDRSMLNTDNLNAHAGPGDWRSVKLERYVNDRNVAVVNEIEAAYGLASGTNDIATEAQYIGLLAPNQKSGDDNLRLGYDIQGFIRSDDTTDADVYAFNGTAGTEVWFDIDATSLGLNSVIELIDANGNVLAKSINSAQEDLNALPHIGLARTMDRDAWDINDQYTTNLNDAGMRVILPGTEGETLTYYLRVSSYDGESRGGYELQVRLQEEQEIAGSTVQKASIRYASTGIELRGLPANSPLTVDAAEVETNNNVFANAQDLGNLLVSDTGQLEVAGNMSGEGDIDWYKFDVSLGGVQHIPSVSGEGIQWPTVFDIDYADGMAGPDIVLYVFDSTGTLVYYGDNSNVADDQPDPLNGPSMDELMRGSYGTDDPFIGSVNLLEGSESTYYVAVTNKTMVAEALSQVDLRVEPINSTTRIAEDQIGTSGESCVAGSPYNSLFPTTDKNGEEINLNVYAEEYTLDDVVLYVTSGGDLYTVNPYTGQVLTDVTGAGANYLPGVAENGYRYNDIIMRADGRLYSLTAGAYDPTEENQGLYTQFSPEDGSQLSQVNDGITAYINDDGSATEYEHGGILFEAMAYLPDSLIGGPIQPGSFIAVGNHSAGGAGGAFTENLLYVFNPDGTALQWPGLNDDPGDILPSNKLPWSQLKADSFTYTISPASQLYDGNVLSLDGLTLEYDLGLVVDINGTPEDKSTFEIELPGGTEQFMFYHDPYISLEDIDEDGYNIGEGKSFALRDANGYKTFEFDRDETVSAGAEAIDIKYVTSTADLGAAIVNAINNASGFNVTASYSNGVVSLQGDLGYNDAGLAGETDISFIGEYPTNEDYTFIEIRSGMGEMEVIAAIMDVMADEGITTHTSGNRLAFPDATDGTFSTESQMTREGSSADGLSVAGRTIIEIAFGETGAEIAAKLEAAINAAGGDLSATVTGDVLTVDGGTNGMITGLTFINGVLYASDDAGNIFTVDDPLTIGFTLPPEDSDSDAAAELLAKTDDEGNAIGPVMTLLYNGDIDFTGLEQGPLNAEDSIYANIMFATGTSDEGIVLFAIDTDGNKAPIFANGQSSIVITAPAGHTDLNLGRTTGLAFSTLDYNLWHVTTNRGDGESGHGTTVAPDDTRKESPDPQKYPIIGDDEADNASFWFGYEANYDSFHNYDEYAGNVTNLGNQDIIGTYDLPGGAHGTLTTNTFSLAGYSSNDLPILTFNYFLETDGGVNANAATDTARVFISDDGVTWQLLATNTTNTDEDRDDPSDEPDFDVVHMVDGSGTWQQCEIDLTDQIANLYDLSNLRLKFEFATAGSMATGDQDGNGIFEHTSLRIAAGDQIVDGDTFEITNNLTEEAVAFEYDMGYSLVLANSAGQAIKDGDTFIVDGHTFEFDKNGSTAESESETYHVISITDGDATFPMAKKLETILNDLFADPEDPDNPFAYTVDNRIYLPLASETTVTSAEDGIIAEGTLGGEAITISIMPWWDAEEVAAETAKVINENFVQETYAEGGVVDYSEFLTTLKLNRDLITFADYMISDPGPHNALNDDPQPGDKQDASTDPPGLPGTHYYSNLRGQDNKHEGFYIDDVVIGFAERGMMVTDAQPNTNFVENTGWDSPTENNPIPVIEGDYQLTIRTASEYTNEIPFRSLDTNDRNTEAITILAPAAGEIANNDCFTINDGVNTQTFQFVDYSLSDSIRNIEGAIRIPFAQGQSAQQIAYSITRAINNAGTTEVTADVIVGSHSWEDGSNRVDLFHVASVTGIDYMLFGDAGENINQVTEEATNVAFIDVTGDGINDIITVNAAEKTARVFQGVQTDDGNLYHHLRTFDVGAAASDIIARDISGDGLVDLIVSNYGDDSVTIAINSGGGNFNQPITIATGNAPSGLELADFDADGDLDLVVTSEDENAVFVHLGHSDGTFGTPTIVPVGLAPKDLVIGDLNGDTWMDIVTVNSGDNSVSVLLGDGLGNFPVHTQTSVGRLPSAIAIGDLNGDDVLDIGVANRGDNTITVLLNDGAGNLAAPEVSTYPTGDDPVDIQILDITGDEINDIGVVNYGDSTLTNYMGLGADAPADGPLLSNQGYWNIGTFSTYGGPTSFVYGSVSGILSPDATQEMLVSNTTGQVISALTPFGVMQVPTVYDSYGQEHVNLNQLTGDTNHEREQGYVLIESNEILYASDYGILSDAGDIDSWVHPGAVAPLNIDNVDQLVPGISISNNLIADAGSAGIFFSGSPNADSMDAAVPFGRIINNTVYDCGTGIMVTENASPTILNNIVSNNRIGISVDATSQTTVIGATVYHENGSNVVGVGNLGNFPIELGADDPLFVDAEHNNFYLAENSRAIDSAIDTIEERDSLANVTNPLGIAPSPILAPEYDLYGQQRSDDPNMDTPPGVGSNLFKDRGAIDRIDFTAPTSSLIDPLDNDAAGLDRNPSANDVFIAYERVSVFSIQLIDPVGAGIDDNTVVSNAVKIYQDGSDTPLVAGQDYFFRYDTGTNVIRLYPGSGLWETGSNYKIVLDNSDDGIADIAGNPVRANRYDGTTIFNISVASFDYGDAPDPTYPSLLGDSTEKADGGARHLQIGDYYLGDKVTHEDNANLVYDEDDGSLITDANGDMGDDGVLFKDSAFMIGETVTVTITASRNGGYLNAWVDFNADGDWDDPFEQIFVDQSLSEGENVLTFHVPEGLESNASYARFRYSSEQGLAPGGEAPDGEVEDYQVYIVTALLDFGDAPESYGTTLADDGARHETSTTLVLGSIVDNEIDGRAHPNALGDDQIGTYDPVEEEVINDEDGVEFLDYLQPGQTSTIEVIASEAGGHLNAWIDFNADGDWVQYDDETGEMFYDANEQLLTWIDVNEDGDWYQTDDEGNILYDDENAPIPDEGEQEPAANQLLLAGTNTLSFVVPADAVTEMTFARFRLSTQEDLTPFGSAPDGEVEDYAIVITEKPRDFGDAPRSYHTRETSEAATVLLSLPGKNNDILLTANTPGTDFNGIKVSFVNEIAYGNNAIVAFNAVTNTYLIDVDPEATTAQKVVDVINEDTGGTFYAILDVTNDINNNGSGLINVAPGLAGITAGGYDGFEEEATSHDLGSGLKLGSRVDAEIDGIPTDDAKGDNLNSSNDEDGFGNLGSVRFVAGEQTTLDFTATLGDVDTAYLNAWIDFNQDGVFSDSEQILIGEEITSSGAQQVDVTIPIEALNGETYARFRLSSQEDLNWYGPASDGEVEDYKVNILKGDATISGYAFQDRNFNTIWDDSEEGRVGIIVYVDLNYDSQDENYEPTLDYDDINNNGVFDLGIDLPTEPYAVTMDDDPGTLDVDETGYYEFNGLFGQVEPYTVCQITPDDSLATYPNGLVTLPDGSHGNADNSYSILLEDGELVENVNFGYFEKSHVNIEDVVVAEGEDGYTDIDVTVTLTHSFGADLTFSYWTQDGTAAIANGDYVPASGTFTFEAQETPVATWSTTVLASLTPSAPDAANNYDYEASGQFVIWQGYDGHDWEIYLFSGEFDAEEKPIIHQLTDNETDDRDATVFSSTNIDKTLEVVVAWTGYTDDGSDTEIFAYNGNFNADGTINSERWSTVLTNNAYNDQAPKLSGNYLTWWGDDGRSNEIFYYNIEDISYQNTIAFPGLGGQAIEDGDTLVIDGITFEFDKDGVNSSDGSDSYHVVAITNNDTTAQIVEDLTDLLNNVFDGSGASPFATSGDGCIEIPTTADIDIDSGTIALEMPTPINLTENDYLDKAPIVQGSNIVWVADKGRGNELFLFTGEYDDFDNPIITQITNNYTGDNEPQIDGNNIVWEGEQGSVHHIFVYQIDTATTTQITSGIYQDNRYPQLSGKDVVWQSKDLGGDWEVYHYNIDAGTAPVNISNNSYRADERPEIVNEMIVWRSYNGVGYETYYHKLRTDGSIVSISDPGKTVYYPQITEDVAVWRSFNGTSYDIVVATQDLPEITQTVKLRIIGDTNIEVDETFFLNIQAVNESWVEYDDVQAMITILNDDGDIDFGDAPESYSTLLVDNGARHLVSAEFPARLGEKVDVEEEGQASENSDGDDKLFSQDDDGVTFTTILGQGTTATVVVEITAPANEDGSIPDLDCYLDAWIDFKGEGNWDGLKDKIFDGRPVTIGTNTLTFDIPIEAVPGLTNARFRLSNSGGLNYTGQVSGGEVEDYQVEIIAKPGLIDGVITVPGTNDDDTFIFAAGDDQLTVDINGAVYSYDRDKVEQILFNGGIGHDTVIFYGSDAIETVDMWTNRGRFTDSVTGNGYFVDTTHVESITAYAGSVEDSVTMTGSAGDDNFVSAPEFGYATLDGTGFALRANSFKNVEAFAAGGNDQACLWGSSGDDLFEASPDLGQMITAGVTTIANDFRYLCGYSVDGGTDKAILNDSEGNDQFFFSADPTDLQEMEGADTLATMTNDGLYLAAWDFLDVTANSTAGTDEASIIASPGDDTFVGSPIGGELGSGSYAKLYGDYDNTDNGKDDPFHYKCIVNEFRYATASAEAGGEDKATLYDSLGSDTFTASPEYAKMAGQGFYYKADHFPKVTAYSNNDGEDAAILYDSAGNDTFEGKPDTTLMYSDDQSYYVAANNFTHLNAYAGSGGVDTATLYGSAGDDVFQAMPSYGKMTRSDQDVNSYYRAYSFQTISAYALGGDNDIAYLKDSAFADLLTASGSTAADNTKASISNDELDFVREAYGFDRVEVESTSAGDKKDVEDSVDFLFTKGLWDDLND